MRRARPAACLAAAALLVMAGCDSALGPEDVAGLYRLETVDGNHVPTFGAVGAIGPAIGRIERGDLLLLPDGTFEMALATDWPSGLAGTFAVSGGTVTLQWPLPPDTTGTLVGSVAGETITIQVPPAGAFTNAPTYVFRRYSRRPPTIDSGRYILEVVNGQGPPFVARDDTIGGVRYVHRIGYDTISLRGVFFTRSRLERWVSYQLATGDSGWSETAWRTVGTYTSEGTTLVLRDYWLTAGAPPPADTVSASATEIIRLQQAPFPLTEVYRHR